MLFSVDMRQKTVNGWYYLLTEDIGRRKHLQVTNNQKLQHFSKSEQGVNKSFMQTVENFTIVVKRGRSGYGFALSGSSPVRVARVDEGSHAEKSGLQKGDSIIKINGQYVIMATFDSVAKIIRHSDKQIVIDVQRPLEMGKLDRSPKKPLEPLNGQQISSSSPQLSQVNHKLDKENTNPSMEASKMETCFTVDRNVVTTRVRKPLPKVLNKSQAESNKERNRDEAIDVLIRCEEVFIQAMQFGIQRYSRPLRHRVLSSQQHVTTFQNIEKLAALSEYHYKQLIHSRNSASSDQISRGGVGSLYKSKVHFLCEAYEIYCDGVVKAHQVLESLRGNRELEGFLQESFLDNNIEPDILTFINKPTEHLEELMCCLQAVLTHTSPAHSDYMDLVKVVDAMQKSCSKQKELEEPDITSASQWPSMSSLSLVSVNSTNSSMDMPNVEDTTVSDGDTIMLDSTQEQMTLAKFMDDTMETSSDQSTILGSSVSIDQDLLELQGCLTFAKNVQAFQLAAPSRHIIYSGELYLCEGHSKNMKVMAVLFSDLLLLTRVQPEGFLTVVEDPIYLQKIFKVTFNCQHEMEFRIRVEPPGDVTLNSTSDLHDVVLRAPSMEQKCVWKSIMEHRILINQSVRDPLPLPCRIGDYVEDFHSV